MASDEGTWWDAGAQHLLAPRKCWFLRGRGGPPKALRGQESADPCPQASTWTSQAMSQGLSDPGWGPDLHRAASVSIQTHLQPESSLHVLCQRWDFSPGRRGLWSSLRAFTTEQLRWFPLSLCRTIIATQQPTHCPCKQLSPHTCQLPPSTGTVSQVTPGKI